MNYGQLIARAWRLVLGNRFLWGLAVIAGCQGGAGAPITPSFNFNFPDGSGPDLREAAPLLSEIGYWIERHIGLLLVALGVFVLVLIAYWVVSTIASAGFLSAVGALDEDRPTGFLSAWRQGAGAFWRLFRLGLLLLLISSTIIGLFAVALLVPMIGFVQQQRDGVGIFLWFGVFFFLLVVVGLPFFILTSVVLIYTQRAIVLDGDHVFPAVGRSIALLRARFGTSLLIWLISVGLALGVGFVVVFLLILLAVPLAIIAVVLGLVFGLGTALVAAVFMSLLALVALWFAGSLGGAFLSAYWTLAYLRLTRPSSDPNAAIA